MAEPTVATALEEIAAGQPERAAETAERIAATNPGERLPAALTAHLRRTRDREVYGSPDGFRAFIDNGSNPALYRAAIDELAAVHRRRRPRTVVDLGAGDGRVTTEVVGAAPDDAAATAVVATAPDNAATAIDDRAVPTEIHLVEPSAELLAQALARPGWPVAPTGHETTAQHFVEALDRDARFDLVQSTFALHTIPPVGRPDLLAGLRTHAATIAVVDFDVPDLDDRGPRHARYAEERYRIALDEYRDVPDAVEGFLMPVLVAQFDPAADRLTFEQPMERWSELFEGAGFDVHTRRIADYWWAPAFLLEATSPELAASLGGTEEC